MLDVECWMFKIWCFEPMPTETASDNLQQSVWVRRYQSGIPVGPAKTYRLRVWVRTTNDTRGLIAVWVTGDAGRKTLARDSLNTEGEWREIDVELIQPKTGTLSIYLNLTNAPMEVVSLGQQVTVRVVEVDFARKRVALSMKNL